MARYKLFCSSNDLQNKSYNEDHLIYQWSVEMINNSQINSGLCKEYTNTTEPFDLSILIKRQVDSEHINKSTMTVTIAYQMWNK